VTALFFFTDIESSSRDIIREDICSQYEDDKM
jgi:hypothetical protein